MSTRATTAPSAPIASPPVQAAREAAQEAAQAAQPAKGGRLYESKPYKILRTRRLSDAVVEMTVYAPWVARKCQAGQFFMLRAYEQGERVPFTFSDWSREEGWIRFIFMVVGKTTSMLADLEELLGGINSFLATYKENNKAEENETFDVERVHKELVVLDSALASLDAGIINSTVETLQELTRTDVVGDTVQKISDKILVGEYDEAAKLIKVLEKEIRNGTY